MRLTGSRAHGDAQTQVPQATIPPMANSSGVSDYRLGPRHDEHQTQGTVSQAKRAPQPGRPAPRSVREAGTAATESAAHLASIRRDLAPWHRLGDNTSTELPKALGSQSGRKNLGCERRESSESSEKNAPSVQLTNPRDGWVLRTAQMSGLLLGADFHGCFHYDRHQTRKHFNKGLERDQTTPLQRIFFFFFWPRY